MASMSRQKEKYKKLTDESEVLSPDEAHARVITELARTLRPELMTELTNDECKAISICMTIAEETDNDVIGNFCDWFMRTRVSLGRKGRSELIAVSKSPQDIEEKVKKGMMKMFTRG